LSFYEIAYLQKERVKDPEIRSVLLNIVANLLKIDPSDIYKLL